MPPELKVVSMSQYPTRLASLTASSFLAIKSSRLLYANVNSDPVYAPVPLAGTVAVLSPAENTIAYPDPLVVFAKSSPVKLPATYSSCTGWFTFPPVLDNTIPSASPFDTGVLAE